MPEVSDLPRIQTLPEQLANQIAAGEVVERPASVVKELIENALDANARNIRVSIERGGLTRIQVSDDGHGIHVDDLERALQRHSTSKIKTHADLQRIHSLGFRGEALGAIASVSRFTLETATGHTRMGNKLQSTGSRIDLIEPAAHQCGTTITVADLFFNTPARRKFLRTETTEYQHIQSVVKQLTLSHFDITFTVSHNGRKVNYYPAMPQDYSKRIAAIMGQRFIPAARQIDYSRDEFRLWGWTGNETHARNQSDQQYFFLNGRIIRDKQVSHAVRIAYANRIYPGRFPCYVLFLEMQPELADINVHPAKQEVRFARQRDVHDFIHASVHDALNTAGDALTKKNIPDPGKTTASIPAATVQESAANYSAVISDKAERKSANPLGNILAQVLQRFVLLESANRLYLFDVHAARQLIAQKELEAVQAGRVPESKPLLFPSLYRTDAVRLDRCEDNLEELQQYGIEMVRHGPEQLMLKRLPTFLQAADHDPLIERILSVIDGGDIAKLPTVFIAHVNDVATHIDHAELNAIISRCVQLDKQQDGNNRPWGQLNHAQLENWIKLNPADE